MASKKMLIWGAGCIGRGFIAELFSNAGYGITFAASRQSKASVLAAKKAYTITHVSSNGDKRSTVIDSYDAFYARMIHNRRFQIADIDFAAVCVYPTALDAVAEQLAILLQVRIEKGILHPVVVLLCMNLDGADRVMAEKLDAHMPGTEQHGWRASVILVQTVVCRTVLLQQGENSLDLITNAYPDLFYDACALTGSMPCITGLVGCKDIHAQMVRKLYTINMLDALLAYMGYVKGCTHVPDGLQYPHIRQAAMEALDDVGKALRCEFGFSRRYMQEWMCVVLELVSNEAVKDTNQRAGQDPSRKLARNDRLIGPFMLCRKHRVRVTQKRLLQAVACGFLFDPPEDESAVQIQAQIETDGIFHTIEKVCGLRNEPDVVRAIRTYYQAFEMQRNDMRRSRT